MNVPTQEQIDELWKKYEVSERLKIHLTAVTKIAVFLAEKLKEKGILVNVEAVRAGAMLHDIDKILTLKTGKHGEVGRNILNEEGFPEMARIAWFHSVDKGLMKDLSWEEKLVRYSDARCNEGDIISVKERFEYVNKRYPPPDPEMRKKGEEDDIALEKEMSEIIGINVANIGEHLE